MDWEALARTGGTLVILMGAARMAGISERLMAGGVAAAIPVTVVRWATTPRQEVLRTTLGAVGAIELQSPCTIVVGDVAAYALLSPDVDSTPPA